MPEADSLRSSLHGDISASSRLEQLRKLQSQLSTMIKDSRQAQAEKNAALDHSYHPKSHLDCTETVSLASAVGGIDESARSTMSLPFGDVGAGFGNHSYASSAARRYSQFSNASGNSGSVKQDIEAGMRFTPDKFTSSPKESLVEDDDASQASSSKQSSVSGISGVTSSTNGRSNSNDLLDMPRVRRTSSSGKFQVAPDVEKGQSENKPEDKSVTSRDRDATPVRGRGSSLRSNVSRSLSRGRRSLSRGRRTINTVDFNSNSNSSTDNGLDSSTRRRSSIFRKQKKEPFLSDKPVSLPNYDFLEKDKDKSKENGSLLPNAKWWHGVFFFSFIAMLACLVQLWAPYPIGARMPSDMVAQQPFSNGCQGVETCICPRETICADDLLSMIFLTISRTSAFMDYPLYMLLFMSKAQNLNNFLQKTALRCWINFSDYHKVHTLFGVIVAIESTSHSFFHILRWARRNDDIQFLWTHYTGITGLTALILTPFIALPMVVPFLKKRMTFEWRKGLHYLSIVWGAALMFHAPQRIFWLIGVPIFIYAADKFVEMFAKTHLIESAHFERLGDTSCIISFENPPGFGKQNSAYVYLMLPWLSKWQFHAFTVFPSTKPNHSSICISKCGNWTGSLMDTITTPTHKPAFVVGPFLSPFSSPAMDSENLVAVASGIGVTPAISLIKQYLSTSRRLNLVWICRDAGLIEHFLSNVEFGGYGYTLIYYTGKRSLVIGEDLPPNVLIFNGRPDLERSISGIIHSIVSGEGLPEELHRNHRVISKAPAELRSKLLLEKALDIYSMDQLFDYTVRASNHHNEDMEQLNRQCNYQGVLSTMKHLLGDDCELVTDNLLKNFEKINVDGSCHLDRNEFEDFMKLMLEKNGMEEIEHVRRGLERMSKCTNLFDSKAEKSLQQDEFGIREHLRGNGKFSAKNWNMLYCGGSEPVLAQLRAYKRKYGIGLSVEKFDW